MNRLPSLLLTILYLLVVVPFAQATSSVTLSDQLDVDPITGTAGTSLPIGVPQGRAGLQPSLSLIYNSSSPNGVMGLGWLLDVGGGIQRSISNAIRYSSGPNEFMGSAVFHESVKFIYGE